MLPTGTLVYYYLQIVGKIGGAFSCAGSAYILQDVLRDPKKRTKSIYHRIMLGLSIMDILSSFFVWFIGSWAMPKGSWFWAAGNIMTCDIAAFLGFIGYMGSPLYNCSLATFYLLQLKYDWSERRMKANEKWLHIVPWSVAVVASISVLATKMHGPYKGICAISDPYPLGCDGPESDVNCIRGIYDDRLYWFASQCFFLLLTTYVSVSMFAVYRYVRDIEQQALRFSFLARLEGQNRKKFMKRSRRVMIQGVLYSVAMVLLYVSIFIHTIVEIIAEKDISVLLLIGLTITPLQGVLNVSIYLVPVFREKLKMYMLCKGNEKGQTHILKPSTEAYYKKTRSSVIVKEKEGKGEILVVQQHTFYPESNMAEENGEGDNNHDDRAAIDADRSGSDM